MSIKVGLEQNGITVQVTKSGELVVAPLAYDETVFKELGTDNAGVNFFIPRARKQFVITGFLAVGDQQIAPNSNANVIIYEASTVDTATVDKILVQFVIKQDQDIPMPGMHVLVNEGKFVNAKTDDDDVHMTLMGYFIDTIS